MVQELVEETVRGIPNAEKKAFFKKIGVNPQTFPLKLTLFLTAGGINSLMPYLTLHMLDLGISIELVAVIYVILPAASVVGPVIMAYLTDLLGDYRKTMAICTIGNGLFHTLLLYVPTYQGEGQVSAFALVRWTPGVENWLLVPENQTHCNQFNDAFGLQFMLNLTNCAYSSNFTQTNSETFQNPINISELELRLEEKFNCSAKLGWVTPLIPFVPETELICQSNITYLTGEVTAGIGNVQVTFWLYLIARIMGTMCIVCALNVMDATTLAVVKRTGKAEYGREKMFGIFGSALLAPIAGTVVDRVSHARGYSDYSAAFYLMDIFLLLGIISYYFIQFEEDKAEKGAVKTGIKLLKYPEVFVFLVMIYVLGILWGFIEAYLFVYLKELDAPNYLLGFTLSVGSLVGIPFLWGSERLVEKFGRVNLIIAGFVAYFVRCFGYSYLTNPFWCLPFEAMEGITYHLMWVAATTYCSLLAPKGLLVTLMTVVGAVHYNFGKGSGSFLGGLTYGNLGARLTFRYFGIGAGICGILFFLLDYFFIRGVVERRLVVEKDERDEADGVEITFGNVSVKRRQSIFAANTFSQNTAVFKTEDDIAE